MEMTKGRFLGRERFSFAQMMNNLDGIKGVINEVLCQGERRGS